MNLENLKLSKANGCPNSVLPALIYTKLPFRIQSPLFFLICQLLICFLYFTDIGEWWFLIIVLQAVTCLIGFTLRNWRMVSLLYFIFLMLLNFPWFASLDQLPDDCTNNIDTVVGIVKEDSHNKNNQIDLIKCSVYCGRKKIDKSMIRLDLTHLDKPPKMFFRAGDTLEIKGVQISAETMLYVTVASSNRVRIYNLTSQARILKRSQLLVFIQAKAEYYLDGFSLSVFKALLTADRSDLSEKWKSTFKKLGVFHIFAISGMHIGILFFWLSFVLRKLVAFSTNWVLKGYGVLLSDIGSVIIIILFLKMIGMPISAKRAVLMLIWWLLVKYFFYWQPNWFILVAVALIILTENPAVLGQISFQLSFISVAGILLLLPLLPISNRTDSYIEMIFKISTSTILISFWLLLFTQPIVQQLIDQRSLLSPLNNLVHIGFVSLIFLPIMLVVLLFNLFTFYFGISAGEFYLYTIVHLVSNWWEKLLFYNDQLNTAFLFKTHFNWNPLTMAFYWILLVLIVQLLKFRKYGAAIPKT